MAASIKASHYHIIIIFLSIGYGLILSFGVPIESIKDREWYLIYAYNSYSLFLKYGSYGLISLIVNEPVWLVINLILCQIFDPANVVRAIIWFSATLFAYAVLKIDSRFFFFLLLILFFPTVINNYIIHLRQGLGISLFVLAYFCKIYSLRFILFILTPLIHSSFFVILFLLASVKMFERARFAVDLRVASLFILTITLGLTVTVAAVLLGARQGDLYGVGFTSVSGLGFLFWALTLFLFVLQGSGFCKKHTFAIAMLIFYCVTYFFLEVSGRIFESTIIIVLLASLELNGWRRKIFVFMVIFYSAYYYITRLGQPVFGWGV
jgi:hypothetical protein